LKLYQLKLYQLKLYQLKLYQLKLDQLNPFDGVELLVQQRVTTERQECAALQVISAAVLVLEAMIPYTYSDLSRNPRTHHPSDRVVIVTYFPSFRPDYQAFSVGTHVLAP